MGLLWSRNPTQFVRDALGVEPKPWQATALQAISDHDRVAIRSGHGVGKSALLSWIILWWHCTRWPAKTACTAPTGHQLSDILWSELAKWRRRMPDHLQRAIEITTDQLRVVDAPKESFAVARASRREEPEAFQGFHSENMLFLADEASGIPEIIFEVGEGSMTTKGAKTVLTGNPTRTSGYFFDAFHKMRAHWNTHHISAIDCPGVDPAYAERQELQYGLDSNVYRVRVLGEFPRYDDDVVIPLDVIEAALVREVSAAPVRPIWGLDVAYFGDDATALCKRQGNVILEPCRVWRQKDPMQVAGLIKIEWDDTEPAMQPSSILVDAIGVGAGVAPRLRELDLPARAINVSESPAVRERFLNLRAELWFKARAWFDARDCRLEPDPAMKPWTGHEDLVGELSTMRYKPPTSSGKIQINSKDEMKRVHGLKSPDLADAFCLTFAAHEEFNEPALRDRYAQKPERHRGASWMSA